MMESSGGTNLIDSKGEKNVTIPHQGICYAIQSVKHALPIAWGVAGEYPGIVLLGNDNGRTHRLGWLARIDQIRKLDSIVKAITGPYPKSAPRLSHLPHPAMQWLVGQALLDPPFRARLLNGSRAEILSQPNLGLSADERAFLLTIRADTLAEFAQAISTHYSPSIGN